MEQAKVPNEREMLKLGNEWLLKNNGSLDITKLPPTSMLDPKNVVYARQHAGMIITNPGNEQALYTAGAIPCVILIMIDRDEMTGKVSKIGMSHVDPETSVLGVKDFFAAFWEAGGIKTRAPEIYLVSGEEENATKVIRALFPYRHFIRGMNCDFNGARQDAAAVGGDGRIYYGNDEKLNREVFRNPADTSKPTLEIEIVGGRASR